MKAVLIFVVIAISALFAFLAVSAPSVGHALVGASAVIFAIVITAMIYFVAGIIKAKRQMRRSAKGA